jgi:hypothetical protein
MKKRGSVGVGATTINMNVNGSGFAVTKFFDKSVLFSFDLRQRLKLLVAPFEFGKFLVNRSLKSFFFVLAIFSF